MNNLPNPIETLFDAYIKGVLICFKEHAALKGIPVTLVDKDKLTSILKSIVIDSFDEFLNDSKETLEANIPDSLLNYHFNVSVNSTAVKVLTAYMKYWHPPCIN